MKRLRSPVIEQPQADGTILFKHDHGISEGRRAAYR